MSISCHIFAAVRDIFPHPTNSTEIMAHNRRHAVKLTIAVLGFFSFLFFGGTLYAQDIANGKTIIGSTCATCHSMEKDGTGPMLMGATSRWKDQAKLKQWIMHNSPIVASHDPYVDGLIAKYKVQMTDFNGQISSKDADDIIAYIKSYKPIVPSTPVIGDPGDTGSDNTLLYGILTLVLAVVAFILLQVNANLKKLADDKSGEPAEEPVSFWRNKAYIAFVLIVLFLVGGYITATKAIGLGRSQNFQPKQPIFYSHKVHAGVNQINCMYCHVGTYQGKQATIPSVNICMNCHMNIKDYKGTAKLYTAEGDEVDGSAEIQKLYKYAGYSGSGAWDASQAKPIEWIRIHNLPDHVYFNHSQHVVAGKQQCQTCHGEIQKMDEVKQFAPLSMGWCLNCHRTTKVNFKDNGFYSIYEKYHNQLKSGERDSTAGVTVEDIGGAECQKCHY